MLKGLCLSLPSVSVDNTLIPVSQKLASSNYDIIVYNYESSAPAKKSSFKFKSYPNENQFNTNNVTSDMSYFQYATMLLETSIALIPFLREEVEREKPDFILHSHLAMWGKLIASHFKIPAVTLFTTFILDKRIMLPFMRSQRNESTVNPNNINDVLSFQRKCHRLLVDLGIPDDPDIWDAYVNMEGLNLSFILEDFQPQKHILDTSYKFLGFPIRAQKKVQHSSLVYLSMGTIFNKDVSIYHLLISVMKKKQMQCLVALGNNVKKEALGKIPENITVEKYVDQVSVLNKSILFITRGGMASVQEAVYCSVPMIVIPEIPEQRLTAERVEQLNIGIQIAPEHLSESLLADAIQKVVDNHSFYVKNIDRLLDKANPVVAEDLALHCIDNYLQTKLKHQFA